VESTNAEIRQAIEGIEKAFKQITTFTFPYPGGQVAGGSEKQKAWSLQGRGNGGTTVIGVQKAGQIVRELIDLEL